MCSAGTNNAQVVLNGQNLREGYMDNIFYQLVKSEY